MSGNALECVQGVEDDYDRMSVRLQSAYGNPCKVTDSIVKAIKDLEIIPEGNTNKLVNSINVIERAWLDMTKLNLEKEMNTTSMVTLVESILPRKLFHDWVRISEKLIDKSSLFKHLLDFLLEEKSICEYMNSDIRSHNKLSSNNFQCESNDNIDVGLTLKGMKLAQDQQNVVISECLNNVSKLMSGMSKNNFTNPGLHQYLSNPYPNTSSLDTWNKKILLATSGSKSYHF